VVTFSGSSLHLLRDVGGGNAVVDTTVHGNGAPDDTHPVRSVYTVISDAANGAVIDSCAGCDTVSK
jgi:hypothetical protein